MKGGTAPHLSRRVQAPTSVQASTSFASRLPVAVKRVRSTSTSSDELAPSVGRSAPSKTAKIWGQSKFCTGLKTAAATPNNSSPIKVKLAVVRSTTSRPTHPRLTATSPSTAGTSRAPRVESKFRHHPVSTAAPSTVLALPNSRRPNSATTGTGTPPGTSSQAPTRLIPTTSTSTTIVKASPPPAPLPPCTPRATYNNHTATASTRAVGALRGPALPRTPPVPASTTTVAAAAATAAHASTSTGTSNPGSTPSGHLPSVIVPASTAEDTDEEGFTLVKRKKNRNRAPRQENDTNLASRNTQPLRTAPRPAVGVARPPPLQTAFPAFRVPLQKNYDTSYDAVAALEDLHPDLSMRNLIGKDSSSVLLPKDEQTYLTLADIASNPSAAIKLIKLDPQTQTTKGIVMGYPLRMPVTLLQRLPQVEEAVRCTVSRTKELTRQVLVTFRGPLPPHVDLGNWGVFYTRPYTPEPLRCFRCQRFGHHQANCESPAICGICSGRHPTQQCLDKYKAKEEVTHRCPNCSRAHHAWNPNCPARVARVDQGREQQVTWVQTQQRTTTTPAPQGTFVWGKQRRLDTTTILQQPPSQDDFPPLQRPTPPQLQQPAHSSASLTRPAHPPPPQPQPQQLPPGSLLITTEILRTFAKELTLTLAHTLSQTPGFTIDTQALESSVSKITDNMIQEIQEKMRNNLPTPVTTSPQPAHANLVPADVAATTQELIQAPSAASDSATGTSMASDPDTLPSLKRPSETP